MKFWLMTPWTSATDMMVLAQQAETLGFEGIMGADHGFVPQQMAAGYPYSDDGTPPIHGGLLYPDVWTTLAAIAAVTTTLKFSTGVYVLPLRNPIEVAKATANIACLSHNRLVIGAGVGWMKEEFDVYGVDFARRGQIMNECIEVMQALWQGGYVEYHGQHFDFDPLQINPVPSEPIPLLLGGMSAPALRRAGRYAQGWLGNGNTVEEMASILPQLLAARVEHQRDDQAFEIILALSDNPSVEQIKQLQAEGATGMVLGFPDSHAPLVDKQKMLTLLGQYRQQF